MQASLSKFLEESNAEELDILEEFLTEELEMAINKKYYLQKPNNQTIDEAIENTFLSIYDCDLPKTLKEVKEQDGYFDETEHITGKKEVKSLYKITIKVEKVKR